MTSSGSKALGSLSRSNTINTMLHTYDDYTVLDVTYDSTPETSGEEETDLIFQEFDTDVPTGFAGVTWCNAIHDGGSLYDCDQHYVRIKEGFYGLGLICHEAGHALGLLHGVNADPDVDNSWVYLGCMRTPVPSLSALGTNQINLINSTY